MTVITAVANVTFMQSICITNELIGSCFTAVSFVMTALFLAVMRRPVLVLYWSVDGATGV